MLGRWPALTNEPAFSHLPETHIEFPEMWTDLPLGNLPLHAYVEPHFSCVFIKRLKYTLPKKTSP